MSKVNKKDEQSFNINGVTQTAYAVIPDAERYLGGTNEIVAVFKYKGQAERFANSLWKDFYLIEEVQSPHFSSTANTFFSKKANDND